MAALRAAAALARNLEAAVRLLACIVVPYPPDLANPRVAPRFASARCERWAGLPNCDVLLETSYCRDITTALDCAVEPHSLVVAGRRKHWSRPREPVWMRALRSRACDLVIVEVN